MLSQQCMGFHSPGEDCLQVGMVISERPIIWLASYIFASIIKKKWLYYFNFYTVTVLKRQNMDLKNSD